MENAFPKTLLQAVKYFSDPDTALGCMIAIRWPDGITCPRCDSTEHSFVRTRRIWICKGCKKHFSVKLGTIMEDSPIGLDKWLSAIWLIVNAKNGISSYEIHRALGITQKSAWFLLHRIRKAMQTGTFNKLIGPVEIDETFIGGLARNMHRADKARKIHGTGGAGKVAVMGLLERHGEVRTMVVPNVKRKTLEATLISVQLRQISCNLSLKSFQSFGGHGNAFAQRLNLLPMVAFPVVPQAKGAVSWCSSFVSMKLRIPLSLFACCQLLSTQRRGVPVARQ